MSSTPSQPDPSTPDETVATPPAAAASPGSDVPATPTSDASVPVATGAVSAVPPADEPEPAPEPAPAPAPEEPGAAVPGATVHPVPGPDEAPSPVVVPAADDRVEIPAEGPLTDEQMAAIAASAQPATIRRAPRYRAFFWTGALLGIVLGLALGLWVSSENLVNRWIYVLVTTLGTTLVTVLLAGACAVWVDRRGAARAAKQREASTGA